MTLLSTEAVTVTVVDPVLYDSGWTQIKGTGAHTDVNILKGLDADAIVYIYGKKFHTTLFEDWRVEINYREPTDFTHSNNFAWRRTYDKGRVGESSGETFIPNATYEAVINTTSLTNSSSEHPLMQNTTGFDLMKGNELRLHAQNTASTSDGIEYRIVAIRSDGLQMVKR